MSFEAELAGMVLSSSAIIPNASRLQDIIYLISCANAMGAYWSTVTQIDAQCYSKREKVFLLMF